MSYRMVRLPPQVCRPSDIIRMLNDQQIVDPSQLGKLVRSFAEGTSVDLTLLRKGKEVKG